MMLQHQHHHHGTPHEHLSPSWSDFVAAWELFRDPMVCALAAGAVLGFLSVYVVLRRMVFVSAAITQSAGLGVALAFYAAIHLGIEVEPIFGAALLSLVATGALLIDPHRLHLSREGVLGFVFAASGGAAVVVGDRIAQEAHDIQSILFGTAVLVRPFDLWVVLVAGGLVLLMHLALFRAISFASFDSDSAQVQGLPVTLLHGAVLVSIGLMVGVSARALGALPVFALSTLPAMSALALGCTLRRAFVVATVVGSVSGFAGYVAAFFGELPVGAAQTLCAALAMLGASLLRLARRRAA
jgi:zinc transport system permease protein